MHNTDLIRHVVPCAVQMPIQEAKILKTLREECYIQGIHKRMVQFQKLTRKLFLTLHGHNVHRQHETHAAL